MDKLISLGLISLWLPLALACEYCRKSKSADADGPLCGNSEDVQLREAEKILRTLFWFFTLIRVKLALLIHQ